MQAGEVYCMKSYQKVLRLNLRVCKTHFLSEDAIPNLLQLSQFPTSSLELLYDYLNYSALIIHSTLAVNSGVHALVM